ncbi:MAG TPA: hypothetical protein VFH67_05025 [bacterium]|nr:hypothetical protein [bacterium]
MPYRFVALATVAALLVGALPTGAALAPQPSLPVGFVTAGPADFAGMRAAGATTVKVIADWSAIEREKGKFVWEVLDQSVTAAERAGLSVVIVLSYTPKWASLATGIELNDPMIFSRQPPKRIADWEGFVTAIVTKYHARVKNWQVWTALSLPLFRGTDREYLALLRATRAKARAVDPSSRIVLATPFGLDLISIRKAILEAGDAFDIISLSPRALAPESLMRPLGVLTQRVLGRASKRIWIEWDPRSVGERATWPAQTIKLMAIARAFAVEHLFWAAEPAPGMTAAVSTFTAEVANRPFAGFVMVDRGIAFLFGDGEPAAAVAWSTTGESSFKFDGNLKALSPTGDAKALGSIGTEPVLVAGIGATSVAEAKSTLQARGLPVPPLQDDFSQQTEVSAKLGRTNVERGLYNAPYRSRRNGAVEPIEVSGSDAVRTSNARDIVFIYFDVDDSFLFYVDGRSAVEISIEVHGASAPDQLGFNVLYDSMTGYRFTSWHVVEAKDGWVTQTIRLNDAGFSNTWGWDFAINAGGNRKEDLTVRSVTVKKVARP